MSTITPHTEAKSLRQLLDEATAERDAALAQKKLGWDRAAEHYRAYEQAMAQRDAALADATAAADMIRNLQNWLNIVTKERDLNSDLLEKANGLCAKLIHERDEARYLCAVATNLAKKLRAERDAERALATPAGEPRTSNER